jgi:hypothetical protein
VTTTLTAASDERRGKLAAVYVAPWCSGTRCDPF